MSDKPLGEHTANECKTIVERLTQQATPWENALVLEILNAYDKSGRSKTSTEEMKRFGREYLRVHRELPTTRH